MPASQVIQSVLDMHDAGHDVDAIRRAVGIPHFHVVSYIKLHRPGEKPKVKVRVNRYRNYC